MFFSLRGMTAENSACENEVYRNGRTHLITSVSTLGSLLLCGFPVQVKTLTIWRFCMKKVLLVFIGVTLLLTGSAFAGENGSESLDPDTSASKFDEVLSKNLEPLAKDPSLAPTKTEQPATSATTEKPAGNGIDMPAKPTGMSFEMPADSNRVMPPLLIASDAASEGLASRPGILQTTETLPASYASETPISRPKPTPEPSLFGIDMPAQPTDMPFEKPTDFTGAMPPQLIASDGISEGLASRPGLILQATGTFPASYASETLISRPKPTPEPSSVGNDIPARPTDMPLEKPTDFKPIKSPIPVEVKPVPATAPASASAVPAQPASDSMGDFPADGCDIGS
jgi:hypothetical protein